QPGVTADENRRGGAGGERRSGLIVGIVSGVADGFLNRDAVRAPELRAEAELGEVARIGDEREERLLRRKELADVRRPHGYSVGAAELQALERRPDSTHLPAGAVAGGGVARLAHGGVDRQLVDKRPVREDWQGEFGKELRHVVFAADGVLVRPRPG